MCQKRDRILKTRGPNARVCVRFDRDVCAMGLEAHNQVADSLWIRCGDLSEIDS